MISFYLFRSELYCNSASRQSKGVKILYYCPYQNHFRSPEVNPSPPAHYRLLHAVPTAPPVDIYINGSLVAKALRYANFTSYFRASPGSYDVKIFPAGKKDKALLETSLQLSAGNIYTVAAIGDSKNISLLPINEPHVSQVKNYTSVRFSHLSPNAPALDISLPDGKNLFKDVKYKQTTDYLSLPQGHYTIRAKQAGTNKVLLIVPNIHLLPNKIYTIYAIGLLNGKPPIQVLIPLDGSTYL